MGITNIELVVAQLFCRLPSYLWCCKRWPSWLCWAKQTVFFGNHKVRIPLPGYLNDVARLLKTRGQGKRIDEGEEEKKIRRDPVSTSSATFKKVFGAMR